MTITDHGENDALPFELGAEGEQMAEEIRTHLWLQRNAREQEQ